MSTVRPLTMRHSGDGSMRSARAIASPTERKVKTSRRCGLTQRQYRVGARTPARLHYCAPTQNRSHRNPRLTLSTRSEILAQRLEEGVRQLADLARSLSDEQWQARVPHDNRKIGDVMTREGLVTAPDSTTLDEAERILFKAKVEKLLLVDNEVSIWDAETRKLKHKIEPPADLFVINAACWAGPKGAVAVASNGGAMHFNAANRRRVHPPHRARSA